MKRIRRVFTPELKQQAVRQVTEGGRSVSDVARKLNIRPVHLRQWMHQVPDIGTKAAPVGGKSAEHGGEFASDVGGPATIAIKLLVKDLLDRYLEEVTPLKVRKKQDQDHRSAACFRGLFGDLRVDELSDREYRQFRDAPKSVDTGQMNREPRSVKPVSRRARGFDLNFFMAVLNWAVQFRGAQGRPLIRKNPWRKIRNAGPSSPRSRRFTDDQIRALRGVVSSLPLTFAVGFELAHNTGKPCRSWSELKWGDIDFQHGRITWRSDEWQSKEDAVSAYLLAALEAFWCKCGCPESGHLFPLSEHSQEAMSRDTWGRQMREALELAKFHRRGGYGWSSLRYRYGPDLSAKQKRAFNEFMDYTPRSRQLRRFQEADRSMLDKLAPGF